MAHPLVCRAPHRRWAMSLLLLLRRRTGPEYRHWRPCRSTTAADSRLLDAPPLLACKCKAAACRRPQGGANRARHTACLRRVPLLDRLAATDRPGGFPLPPFPPERRAGTFIQAGAPASKAHLALLLPASRACSSCAPFPPVAAHCTGTCPYRVTAGRFCEVVVASACFMCAHALCAQDGI